MADVRPAGHSILRRRIGIAALTAVVVVLLLLAGLAAFPWGALRGTIEARLSQRLGRPVTIASIERLGGWSLRPLIAIRGVRIPQAAWAGRGDLLTVNEARLRFAALPVLIGRFRPDSIEISGMRAVLVRDAAGRKSWAGGAPTQGGARSRIGHFVVRNSMISYRDAKRDRSFVASLTAEAARGLALDGRGEVHGAPVRLKVRGGRLDEGAAGRPWPFRVEIIGDAVGMTLDGKADSPLDVGHFSARATAHGADLALIDAIIEAGLPATQPVKLRANVRRDSSGWTITGLAGTVGRSDIAGRGTVGWRDGRHRIDGVLSANRFDFDDLSSDEGRRRAAAKRARFGPRLVPDTAIDLDNFAKTDGTLRVDVRQLLWPGSSPFRRLQATIAVDRSRVTVEPLTLGMTQGTVSGRMVIDQRRSGPRLTVALDVGSARLIDFFPYAEVDGALRGRVRLEGVGRTIRAAIGRSSGSIALIARDGIIPARTASLLGQDVGRALTADEGELATLRCAIIRLDVVRGIARPAPLLIDTTRAATEATGTIDLASEALALALKGAPKKGSLLRMTAPVPIAGTIKAPDVRVPEKVKSVGGVLDMVGQAIAGKQGAIARDADCDALAGQALR